MGLYASLNDKTYACAVSKTMSIPTSTNTTDGRDSTLECTPGTDTAGCCWWGRGPIQTTGPNNYGDLQNNVIKKIAKKDKSYKGIDLCKNPQQLCKDDKVKWIGAVHYWANNVQTDYHFEKSLKGFAKKFNLSESKQGKHHFASGTGGVVNAGTWDGEAHRDDKRVIIFKKVMKALKDAGAEKCDK